MKQKNEKNMRKFTENDLTGLARAFQTFMGSMNGQQVKVSTHLPVVERALAEGITVDELLNAANYFRAKEITPNATLDEYADILIHNQIPVKELKDEPDWDDPNAFPLLAEIFHDYYMEICPKGGTWGTAVAKMNLQHALGRYSLQGIMSEELIRSAMEKTGLGRNMTCYQFIQDILINRDSYHVDTSLSEEQTRRRNLEACSHMDANEADSSEGHPEAGDFVELDTEGSPDPDDPTIYGETDGSGEENVDGVQSAFVTMPSPKEYKRAHVLEAVKGLEIKEFKELSRMYDEEISVDEFITNLADGKFDTRMESAEARNAHQYINGTLYPHFIECAAWQGVEVSEETAANMDLLKISWDMRDKKTRKLQKIKELIYNNAVENTDDVDLMSVIDDLEKLYSKEEED